VVWVVEDHGAGERRRLGLVLVAMEDDERGIEAASGQYLFFANYSCSQNCEAGSGASDATNGTSELQPRPPPETHLI
jgi:hypothetical protein